MDRARALGELRVCEECGRTIERGRENQFLCRRCQQEMERNRRKGRRPRPSRRDALGWEDGDD